MYNIEKKKKNWTEMQPRMKLGVTPYNFITNFFLIHKLKWRPTIKWI